MGWSDQINVADEHFHERSSDPYWSENTLFGFTIPEKNICGFVYWYFRPNMNLVVAGPAMWDNTGEDVYNCRYYGWDQHLALPEGADMYDFELSNSLSCTMVKPQEEYRIAYDRNGFKLDLTWTAWIEPHYMKLSTTGDEDPGIKNWVKKDGEFSVGHYEHMGHFKGTIEFEGETLEVDCGALRDRGWGPRHADIADPLRAGWPYVFANPQSGWHLYDPQTELSFEEDPIEGTTETVTTGFYVRDGVKSKVVEGTRKAIRGRDGRVLKQEIHCVDELGRELHAVGEGINWLKWPINSDILNWWSMVRWEYDGLVAYGEDQDFMNFKHYRRYWKQLIEKDTGLLNCLPSEVQ